MKRRSWATVHVGRGQAPSPRVDAGGRRRGARPRAARALRSKALRLRPGGAGQGPARAAGARRSPVGRRRPPRPERVAGAGVPAVGRAARSPTGASDSTAAASAGPAGTPPRTSAAGVGQRDSRRRRPAGKAWARAADAGRRPCRPASAHRLTGCWGAGDRPAREGSSWLGSGVGRGSGRSADDTPAPNPAAPSASNDEQVAGRLVEDDGPGLAAHDDVLDPRPVPPLEVDAGLHARTPCPGASASPLPATRYGSS